MVKRFRVRQILTVFALACCIAIAYLSWSGEPVLAYLVSTPHFLLYGFSRDKYWHQAFKVQEAVSAALPPSKDIMRDHIAAYARGGESGFLTHPNELDICNVPNEPDQEKIIAIVRERIKVGHMIPMRIDFYEEQALPDGSKAGGPRKLTRSIVVE
jgi:hypothetical protein